MPVEANWAAVRDEALKLFTELGTDLRNDLWTEENASFLKIMAEDTAGLAMKLATATDEAKKRRYRRSLDLIANSVAVAAFSRLNVIEKQVEARVLSLLEKSVKLGLRVLLGAIGIA